MFYQSGFVGFTLLACATTAIANDNTIHLIIKYKERPAAFTALKIKLSQDAHLPVHSLRPMAGGAYSLVYETKSLSHKAKSNLMIKIINQLKQNPNIAYAVEDRMGHFKPLPTQPNLSSTLSLLSHDSQWDEFTPPAGVMLESAPGHRDGAWSYTTGHASKPIVVAVLDTGVALNPSLINNLVKDQQGNVWGWNFAANNRNINDETGSYHGTHVAGTIAGYGAVMMGMGEDLKILPLKIPDRSGMFYESQVINAIYWAVGGDVPGVPANSYPAKVLNMSFGVDERPGKEIDHCDEALQEAIFYARKKGAVISVAAGNDNQWEHYNAPAVCNSTIKVAATGPAGLRSYYSNYGPSISFAAPGGDLSYGKKGGILSTVNPGGGYQNSGFDFYQGTSMASPHVAGVAGLIFAVNDGAIKPEKVEQILYATTHDFGQTADANNSCKGTKPCGHGILNAENAIKAAIANYDLILTAPKVNDLKLSLCGKDVYQPKSGVVTLGKLRWVQLKKSCTLKTTYLQPALSQTKTGKIIANYGATVYQLDDSLLKQCQIIGFDGLGCYF
ncbi:S8 family serine peptidase [Legionella hackeliae]|uniref:Serine metalloprotease n=1 Tax=Legionella hackeliae TaxID=449 RepID=A0A0A8USL6_LEGHA|nr:S8 family serine peptidase [Legionella hackeliae]KTD10268.1 serine metalloprotease [Legionella hackeliae]CEK09764.1 Serine metalloprotease [Legionella hackeliae]STX49674.1 AprE, Subtilisin-like serine protease [Legionella hackeliae]